MQTSSYQILAAFTGKDISEILPATSWKEASTECQQFSIRHRSEPRHRADRRAYICIINRLDMPKYHTSSMKHSYQCNQYCKLHNQQKCIIGCWKCDFDKEPFTPSKYKCAIWIYRWTRWASCWQPAQLSRNGSLPSTHIWFDVSGSLIGRLANYATGSLGPGPGHAVTVRNCGKP